MIEGIVFDMDGVLIDSHPVHRVAWSKFLATVGKSVSDEGLSFILAGRRREEILRHFLGDLPESKIAEYGHQKDLFFEENFQDVKLIPGVREVLGVAGDRWVEICDRDIRQFGADVGNCCVGWGWTRSSRRS